VAQQETVCQSLASSKTIPGDKRGNMLNSCTCGAGLLKRNEELFIDIVQRFWYEYLCRVFRP